MPLLSERELADLRVEIIDLLPDTCQIERSFPTNIGGNVEEGWVVAVTSALCRVDPAGAPMAATVAEREAGITHYILTLRYDEDIQDGDRVLFDSKYYNLIELHDAHSSRLFKRGRISLIRGD